MPAEAADTEIASLLSCLLTLWKRLYIKKLWDGCLAEITWLELGSLGGGSVDNLFTQKRSQADKHGSESKLTKKKI